MTSNWMTLVLASAHPDEASAREQLSEGDADTPYHGVWLMPGNGAVKVHVFCRAEDDAELAQRGFTRA